MKISEYLKDHNQALVAGFAYGLVFTIVLYLFGLNASEIVLIWIFLLITISAFVCFDYIRKKRRFQYLLSMMDSLDKKYLFAEVADKPISFLEQTYFRLIKTALKSMTDEVSLSNRMKEEYRDYIEQWIHEIKVPITGIKLICENNKTDDIRKIITQTELIERDVERVLFYARLGSVEKDYLIREISLEECVMNTLSQNKQFLIQSGVCVNTDAIAHRVYSDNKWIEFIINQIITNSIKYRSDQPPVIDISTEDMGRYVSLSIRDNGVGIQQSEISRIFDKGFVGSNGRSSKNSTGIGLYLCKQLCNKLSIDIEAESGINQYTTVRLHFPKSDHLNI